MNVDMALNMDMNRKGAVSAIIVAAGRGSRTGLGFNKVLADLGGISILERTIRAFIGSGLVREVILVISRDDEEKVREIIRKLPFDIVLTYGGSQRQESVYNGLMKLSPDADIVLIHDAARPFVNADIIGRCIEGVRLYGAVCAGMPAKDTIKYTDPEGYILQTPDRSYVWIAQTPQAFRREIIIKAHENAAANGIKATDDAMLAERIGIRVRMVEGSSRNIKITSKEDLLWAEAILGGSDRGLT
ncbi:MAG TPA: 2-C-methyl-D-erythritol 4-phosphate cytidylyltransferase [Thermoclostridium sp.]|nr:2-C-methyl-D-erythritol 4-phosphate cytidylyltransferase [Thermoclostridium sp.]HPU45039.1 2-C-methyl-D-erythritol 4-phosphate cytidylyltransferase [Thermoclostridium sp.]